MLLWYKNSTRAVLCDRSMAGDEQDVESRVLDRLYRHALARADLAHQRAAVAVHHLAEGVEALPAHGEVVAYVHEDLRLQHCLRGAHRVRERRQGVEREWRGRVKCGGAQPELYDESLQKS